MLLLLSAAEWAGSGMQCLATVAPTGMGSRQPACLGSALRAGEQQQARQGSGALLGISVWMQLQWISGSKAGSVSQWDEGDSSTSVSGALIPAPHGITYKSETTALGGSMGEARAPCGVKWLHSTAGKADFVGVSGGGAARKGVRDVPGPS